MEFRFRSGDRGPRCSSSSASGDSPSARFSHPREGYFGAQGMRAGPFRGGLPPAPPLFAWDAARREWIIREEVERRLIEEQVRRELEVERDLSLARGLHRGFGPDPFFTPAHFMPPPPTMPMSMHPPPHAPPPIPFEEFGARQEFGLFGPRRHAGFGQRMLLLGEEGRWSPPPPKPKHKLELREIEPCENSKVPRMKRKADAIAATTEPRKVQKPAKDWSYALCQVSATCEAGLTEHLEGKKHKAKLVQCGASKAINDDKSNLQATTRNKKGTCPNDAPKKICILVDGAMHEVVQKKNYMWCERCKIRCDSNLTMAGHLRGKKHSELNKVWTSIEAVRMNRKTKVGLASPCRSKVNANGSPEIPTVIKGDIDMAIEVDENGPIKNPVEIKNETTNMTTEVHENSPVETPVEAKKEGTDMTNDPRQVVPKEE